MDAELARILADIDARLYALEHPDQEEQGEPIEESSHEVKGFSSVKAFMEHLWGMPVLQRFELTGPDHYFVKVRMADTDLLEYRCPGIKIVKGNGELMGRGAYWPSFVDKYPPLYAWMKEQFGSRWLQEWQSEWGKENPWQYGTSHPTACPQGIGCGPQKVNGMVK